MLRADLHLHTYYSGDGVSSPQEVVRWCIQRGINCVAVTDHNSINGALEVREIAPFEVIIAEEIKTSQGEITGFFLNEEIPRGLSPQETVARIKAQGGLVSIPHPFDRLRRSVLHHRALEEILAQVDIIEGFNARTLLRADSARALRFAREYGFPAGAGSDAHIPQELGNAYVEMPEFEGPQEFLASLRRGTIRGRLSSPTVHLWSTLAKLRKRFAKGLPRA